MTADLWARIVKKNPLYADCKVVIVDGLVIVPPAACRHLGNRLPGFESRRACGLGKIGAQPVGFSGVPGVRPCCDCGPDRCDSYLPKIDDDP